MKSVSRIISAKDYGGGGKSYLRKQQLEIKRRGIIVNILSIDKPEGKPVYAEIRQGQWIARCEDCRGASFVDPEEPVFFCFGCGNRTNGGRCRPVIIPDNWRDIEQVLLERPVDDVAGLTDNERAGLARPVLFVEKNVEGKTILMPLVRSWEHTETIDDLKQQQDEPVKRYKKSRGQL